MVWISIIYIYGDVTRQAKSFVTCFVTEYIFFCVCVNRFFFHFCFRRSNISLFLFSFFFLSLLISYSLIEFQKFCFFFKEEDNCQCPFLVIHFSLVIWWWLITTATMMIITYCDDDDDDDHFVIIIIIWRKSKSFPLFQETNRLKTKSMSQCVKKIGPKIKRKGRENICRKKNYSFQLTNICDKRDYMTRRLDRLRSLLSSSSSEPHGPISIFFLFFLFIDMIIIVLFWLFSLFFNEN